MHLENRENGVDVEILREDLAVTSPKFPYYQKRITITELKSYTYKPPVTIKEPIEYQKTGVHRVNVINDTDRELWISFKDTEAPRQERITLNPKSTDFIKSYYTFASSGGSAFNKKIKTPFSFSSFFIYKTI